MSETRAAVDGPGPPDAQPSGPGGLLRPGTTCWRVERAQRIAFVVDGAAYFAAAKAAMRKARRSILLVAWDFDPRTRFEPGRHEAAAEPDRVGEFLERLVADRPLLRVHVLVWDMALPIAIQNPRPSLRAADPDIRRRLRHVRDDRLPAGACHHQKILVIDDAVAFCGGMDLTGNRWDTPAHADRDPRRQLPDGGGSYEPRHDVMMAVDGPAAAALGDLARERWRRATGERLEPAAMPSDPWPSDPWPDGLAPDAVGAARIGIARTEPAWRGRPEVREGEALFRLTIASARRRIYLESQYVASTAIGDALAARLAEPDGPEVVIVCPAHSPAYFDRLAMDPARDDMLARLRAADAHGRFRAYAPRAAGGTPIIVHSKVTVIDDRLLRIGSANLNNRSMGFDSECDLAIEAVPGDPNEEEVRQAIRRFLARLLAEHLAVAVDTMAETLARTGRLVESIESLVGRGRRLEPILRPPDRGVVGAAIAKAHLFDPTGTADAWRPWKRRGG